MKVECTHLHILEDNLCFCNVSHLRVIHWKLCNSQVKPSLWLRVDTTNCLLRASLPLHEAYLGEITRKFV